MASVSEWAKLSKAERISDCRKLAFEAERLGKTALPEDRQHYSDVAEHWNRLADEIKKAL